MMKITKSLLLGSAAGLIAAGGRIESGRYKRPGILPRRLVGRGGVSVVRRNGAINRMEDSDAKVCKEAFA